MLRKNAVDANKLVAPLKGLTINTKRASRALCRCQNFRSPLVSRSYATIFETKTSSGKHVTEIRDISSTAINHNELENILKAQGFEAKEIDDLLEELMEKTNEKVAKSGMVAAAMSKTNATTPVTDADSVIAKEPPKEKAQQPVSTSLGLSHSFTLNLVDPRFLKTVDRTKSLYGRQILMEMLKSPRLTKEKREEFLTAIEWLVGNSTLINDISDNLATIGSVNLTTKSKSLTLSRLERIVRCLSVLESTRKNIISYEEECYNDFQMVLKPFKGEQELRNVLKEFVDEDSVVGTHFSEQTLINVLKNPPTKLYLESFEKLALYAPTCKKLKTFIVRAGRKNNKKLLKKQLTSRSGSLGHPFCAEDYLVESVGLTVAEYRAIKTFIPDRFVADGNLELEKSILKRLYALVERQTATVKQESAALLKELSKRISETAGENSLKELFRNIGTLDVLVSHASIASDYNLSRPILSNGNELEIHHGVCISDYLESAEAHTNHFVLSPESPALVINGPQGSGKSTYIRTLAQTVLLAHIGSFVPADYAKIGIIDNIVYLDETCYRESRFSSKEASAMRYLSGITERSLVLQDFKFFERSLLEPSASILLYLSKVNCRAVFTTNDGLGLKNSLMKLNKDSNVRFLKSNITRLKFRGQKTIKFGRKFEFEGIYDGPKDYTPKTSP